jgi:Response regulator of the LytR/AlgR family
MKIKLEIDESLAEDEITIRSQSYSDQIQAIHAYLTQMKEMRPHFEFFKGNEEYFFSVDEIIFFETSGEILYAHTKDDAFQTKMRLYELEEILPGSFIRVSKSCILNSSHVHSIDRKLNTSSLVQFRDTHKEVYVSRLYYKLLKEKMKERRIYEKK